MNEFAGHMYVTIIRRMQYVRSDSGQEVLFSWCHIQLTFALCGQFSRQFRADFFFGPKYICIWSWDVITRKWSKSLFVVVIVVQINLCKHCTAIRPSVHLVFSSSKTILYAYPYWSYLYAMCDKCRFLGHKMIEDCFCFVLFESSVSKQDTKRRKQGRHKVLPTECSMG